jgi:hypothetical protein
MTQHGKNRTILRMAFKGAVRYLQLRNVGIKLQMQKDPVKKNC